MLNHLHVKDLALIDSSDVEFGPGLNILTGETGAGKSILFDSIGLALGQKAGKDLIRKGQSSGFVELVFSDFTEEQLKKLNELEVEPEDGQLIIRRKITDKRSEIRINDQASTVAKLRSVTELLIDIHGQHEHQSLLKEGSHLRILDAFLSGEAAEAREAVAASYRRYSEVRQKYASLQMDEGQLKRELDFLRFEIGEIEAARLREGEEEELSEKARRFQNAKKILGSVTEALRILEGADFSRAVRELQDALQYDGGLKGPADSLFDLESIAGDTARELSHYLDENDFDEEEATAVTERLDFLRNLLLKYGGTVGKVMETLEAKKARLLELEHYEESRERLRREGAALSKELLDNCSRLSEIRKRGAELLCGRIRGEMEELGFLSVQFDMAFSVLPKPGPNGRDEARFMVSLNPGEPVRPLSEVASGGELSRIMLSIKTVLADTDSIPTLIFDEIDTGISGRTAEKVSDKLKKIARLHQVILITHLPQIAAKADTHFVIEKTVEGDKTRTGIRELEGEESVRELARLLAGGRLTETVLANARELKLLANNG